MYTIDNDQIKERRSKNNQISLLRPISHLMQYKQIVSAHLNCVSFVLFNDDCRILYIKDVFDYNNVVESLGVPII